MEKQKFYEKRKHGTPTIPMECFVTRADGNQHFLVPLHWHRNIEIMQMLHGTAVITIGNEMFSCSRGRYFLYQSGGTAPNCFRGQSVSISYSYFFRYRH